jgi:hypothetical protein
MPPFDGICRGHDQTLELPTSIEYAHLFYGEVEVVSGGALVSILNTNQAVKAGFALVTSTKARKNSKFTLSHRCSKAS